MTAYDVPVKRRVAWFRKERHAVRTLIFAGLIVVAGCQFLPECEKKLLGSVIADIGQCRDSEGRFPPRGSDLPKSLQSRLSTAWGSRITYAGYQGGFTLRFNCFCPFRDGLDMGRYEYDSSSNDWFHWYD